MGIFNKIKRILFRKSLENQEFLEKLNDAKRKGLKEIKHNGKKFPIIQESKEVGDKGILLTPRQKLEETLGESFDSDVIKDSLDRVDDMFNILPRNGSEKNNLLSSFLNEAAKSSTTGDVTEDLTSSLSRYLDILSEEGEIKENNLNALEKGGKYVGEYKDDMYHGHL